MNRQKAMEEQLRLFPEYESLPEICLALRSGVNGSNDPWRPDAIQDTIDMLQGRLDTWQDSANDVVFGFDEAVYSLIRATLREVKRYTRGTPSTSK